MTGAAGTTLSSAAVGCYRNVNGDHGHMEEYLNEDKCLYQGVLCFIMAMLMIYKCIGKLYKIVLNM